MSVPSAPRIISWPSCSDGQIRFYWEAPTSDGGSPITQYTLACTAIAYSQDLSANVYDYLVTGLTNQTNLAFTITATNTNGTGPAASFPIVQAGLQTIGPSIATLSTLNTSTAYLTWTPSTLTGEASLRAYLIQCFPSTSGMSSFFATQYPHKSTMAIAGLSTNIYYQFLVRGVNDVGYCPPFAFTSTVGFGIPPAGGFSPSSITNLRVWVDASDPLYASTTGVSTVVNVQDKSSNAYTFSNTSGWGRTPSSFNTSYTAFTGPGVSGNTLGYNAGFTVAQPYMVFFVGRNSKPLTNFSMLYANTGNTMVTFVNNNDRYSMFAGTQVDSVSAGSATSSIIISALYSGASSYFVQNGSTIVSGINPGTGGSTDGLGLAQHNVLNGFAFGGQFGEFLIYNSNMVLADRQKVEGYLAWKWGLQSNLQPSHPYRSNAPLA